MMFSSDFPTLLGRRDKYQEGGEVADFETAVRRYLTGDMSGEPLDLPTSPEQAQMQGLNAVLNAIDPTGPGFRELGQDLFGPEYGGLAGDVASIGIPGPEDVLTGVTKASRAISPAFLLNVLERRPATRLLHGTGTEAAENILKTGKFKKFSQAEEVARGLERAGVSPERFRNWPDEIKNRIFEIGYTGGSGGGARSDVFLTPNLGGSYGAAKFARMGGETSEYARQVAAQVAKAEDLGYNLHEIADIAKKGNYNPIGLIEDRLTKSLGFEGAFDVIRKDPSQVGTVLAVDVPRGANTRLDEAIQSAYADARRAIEAGEIKTTDDLKSFLRSSLEAEFAVPPGAATPVRKEKYQKGGQVGTDPVGETRALLEALGPDAFWDIEAARTGAQPGALLAIQNALQAPATDQETLANLQRFLEGRFQTQENYGPLLASVIGPGYEAAKMLSDAIGIPRGHKFGQGVLGLGGLGGDFQTDPATSPGNLQSIKNYLMGVVSTTPAGADVAREAGITPTEGFSLFRPLVNFFTGTGDDQEAPLPTFIRG